MINNIKNLFKKEKIDDIIFDVHPICANCGHCYPIDEYGFALNSQSDTYEKRFGVKGCTLCGAGMLGRGVRLIYIEGEPCYDCGAENGYDWFHLGRHDSIWM